MKGRRNANNIVAGQFRQIHKPRQFSPPRRTAHSREDFLIFQQQFRGDRLSDFARNPGVKNRVKRMSLGQCLRDCVSIKADNHPLRSSARASRIMSVNRSNFPARRSDSASADNSRQSCSFSSRNNRRWRTNRLSSSIALIRWTISAAIFAVPKQSLPYLYFAPACPLKLINFI
jgi:hypothetical protein